MPSMDGKCIADHLLYKMLVLYIWAVALCCACFAAADSGPYAALYAVGASSPASPAPAPCLHLQQQHPTSSNYNSLPSPVIAAYLLFFFAPASCLLRSRPPPCSWFAAWRALAQYPSYLHLQHTTGSGYQLYNPPTLPVVFAAILAITAGLFHPCCTGKGTMKDDLCEWRKARTC